MGKVVKAVGKAIGGVFKAVGNFVGMLFSPPKQPKATTNAASETRLNASLVPEENFKIIFGETAVGTDLRFWETYGTGNNGHVQVFAGACHEMTAYGNLYLDEKPVPFAGNVATGAYAGLLTRRLILKGISGAGIALGSGTRWTASSAMTGCSLYALDWAYSAEKMPQGIPSRVTQIGKGAKVYDPRRDSTRGGAGAHRANDPATWEYTPLDSNNQPIGRNNALQQLTYQLGIFALSPVDGQWKLRGGKGAKPDDINFDSFIIAANICEIEGWYSDCILSTGDSHGTNEGILEAAAGGELADTGGRFSYYVSTDDTANVAFTFTEDDIVGDVDWEPQRSMAEQFNELPGTFTDPTALFQTRPLPLCWSQEYYDADGYKKRAEPEKLTAVQDPAQGQKLLRRKLNKSRFQGVFSAPFNLKALRVRHHDIIRLTFKPFGWTNKLFRVTQQGIATKGGIQLVLEEESPAIYLPGAVVAVPAPGVGNGGDPFQPYNLVGFGATATGVVSGTSARDAMSVYFAQPGEQIDRTEARYKRTGDANWTPLPPLRRDQLGWIVEPLLPTTNYTFQARHVTLWNVPGEWAQVTQTTNAVTVTPAGQLKYADGTLVEALKPGEAGANVTETRTAALVTNQGPGATAPGNRVLNDRADGNVRYISYPDGGQYHYSNAIDGQIQIVMPYGADANTMIRFTVDIYDYNSGRTVSYTIGGYNYSDGGGIWRWINLTAQYIGPRGFARPVKFGFYSGKCYVWIGNVGDTWSYPQVRVRDVQISYSGWSLPNWPTGWSVTMNNTDVSAIVYDTIATPRAGDQVFGEGILEQPGGLVATRTNFRTDLGTSALVYNQGGLATRNDVLWSTHVTGDNRPADNAGSNFSLARMDGASVVQGSTISKTGSNDYGNGAVYTIDRYIGSAYVSARNGNINGSSLFGLTDTAVPAQHYDNISYAIFFPSGSSAVYAYELGGQVQLIGNPGALSDVWAIDYNGSTVKWLQNGIVRRTVQTTGNRVFRAQTSMYHAGVSKLTDFSFGPSAQVARMGVNTFGADGATLYAQSQQVTAEGTSALVANQGPGATAAANRVMNDRYTNLRYVEFPDGGDWQAGTITAGQIQITMPHGYLTGSYAMIRLTVDIYDYASGDTVTYHIGGYTYASPIAWYSTYASYLGPRAFARKVRWGFVGGKAVIWIGSVGDGWQYTTARVRDVQVGYSGASATGWETGWNVTLTNADVSASVFATVTTPRPGDQVFGEGLLESPGVTATLPNFKTGLGTSALVASQSVWVTTTEPIGKISRLRSNGRATNSFQVSNGILTGATLQRTPVYILGSSVVSSAARISITAHSLVGAGFSASYAAGTIDGLAFNTVYYVYAYDPDIVGGSVTYVASTDPNLYVANADYLFLDNITTVQSGGGSGVTPVPPRPPGYVDCVSLDAWLPTGQQARNVQAGDRLLMLAGDGSGMEQGQVQGIRKSLAACMIFETVSGITLTCSHTTPIPFKTAEGVGFKHAWECDGSEILAVLDADGFRWEALAKQPGMIGEMPVALISADNGVYAAGNQKNRFIFTHNIQWKRPE